MTKVKSEARWIRIAPRKLAKVVEVVRGKPALEALALLSFMPQKGARILEKVLKSAVANAKNNYKLADNALVVHEAYVNKGIVMKRWQAKARGRMHPIQKRTSHVTVWLSAPEAAKPAAAEPAKAPKKTKAKKQAKQAKEEG